MICFVITFVAVTVEFIATTDAVFFAGKFINGFAVGAIATITVAYTGEVREYHLVNTLLSYIDNEIDYPTCPPRSIHLSECFILYSWSADGRDHRQLHR
jgi:hypothetical protein